MTEGHFKPGSTLPKIEAIIEFLEGGGRNNRYDMNRLVGIIADLNFF